MINVIGQLQGTSGYASHFRGLVNELNKLTECKITTNLQIGFERQVNDQELQMIKRKQDYDINLIITHPLYWRSNLNAKRNFVYLVFEGDKVPKWILEECLNEKIEKIICPSEHTKQALINTRQEEFELHTGLRAELKDINLEDKLIVIPHGYNPKDFYHLEEAIEIDENDKPVHPNPPFTFLANKGLRNLEDRGGLQYLIKAYCEEFKTEENTKLVLKINPAYGIPDLLKLFPELKERDDVVFNTGELTVKQLNELYNDCDVFVSPTRAEAFNIPCLEALACGKPVISTTFGGQTDFIKENYNGWLIDGELTEVKHELEYEGIKWLTPNIEDLKKILRMCYTNRGIVEEVSKNCVKSIEHLTWKNTAKQIYNLI